MKKLAFAFALVGFVSSGCGSARFKEQDQVNSIQKAAVVAIGVYQPAREGGGLGTQSGKLMLDSPHVTGIYKDLVAELQKNMGWKMATYDQVRGNATFTQAYEKTMKGFQNKVPPGEGENLYRAEGILDQDSPRILGVEGRNALIDALKVDAIVVVTVRTQLKGTVVMGIGPRKPQALVTLAVYKRGQEKPVWFDGMIEGAVSEESIGMLGNKELLDQLVAKSSKTAFAKIIK